MCQITRSLGPPGVIEKSWIHLRFVLYGICCEAREGQRLGTLPSKLCTEKTSERRQLVETTAGNCRSLRDSYSGVRLDLLWLYIARNGAWMSQDFTNKAILAKSSYHGKKVSE
jgi:hypothetical protein